jgi:hypothetical protein
VAQGPSTSKEFLFFNHLGPNAIRILSEEVAHKRSVRVNIDQYIIDSELPA